MARLDSSQFRCMEECRKYGTVQHLTGAPAPCHVIEYDHPHVGGKIEICLPYRCERCSCQMWLDDQEHARKVQGEQASADGYLSQMNVGPSENGNTGNYWNKKTSSMLVNTKDDNKKTLDSHVERSPTKKRSVYSVGVVKYEKNGVTNNEGLVENMQLASFDMENNLVPSFQPVVKLERIDLNKLTQSPDKVICPADIATQTNVSVNIKSEDSETDSNSVDTISLSILPTDTEVETVVKTHDEAGVSKNFVKTETGNYQCKFQLCNRIFGGKKRYEEHHKFVHQNKYNFSCTKCHRRYARKNSFKRHQRNCKGSLFSKTCPVCSKLYRSEAGLKAHLQTHYESRDGVVVKEFTSTGKPLRSPKCKEKFGKFKCKTCSKGFSTEETMHMHQRFHTNFGGYKCYHCEELFKYAGARRSHMMEVHPAEFERYKCNTCAVRFRSLEKLNRHERIHTVEKVNGRYLCKTCQRSFGSIMDLERHERVHADIFPYLCDHCGKKLRTKGSLTFHLVNKHNYIHKCTYCSKRFTNMAEVVHHEASHVYVTSTPPFTSKFSPKHLQRDACHEYISETDSKDGTIASQPIKASCMDSYSHSADSEDGQEISNMKTSTSSEDLGSNQITIPASAYTDKGQVSDDAECAAVGPQTQSIRSKEHEHASDSDECIEDSGDCGIEISTEIVDSLKVTTGVEKLDISSTKMSLFENQVSSETQTVKEQEDRYEGNSTSDKNVHTLNAVEPLPSEREECVTKTSKSQQIDFDIANNAFAQKRISDDQHKTSNVSTKDFTCTKCSKRFANKYTLATHETKSRCRSAFTRVFTSVFTKKCDLCPAGFRTDIGLKAHLQMHEEHRQVNADDKYAVSVNVDDQEKNAADDEQLDMKALYCHDCSKSFCSIQTFQAHHWIHLNVFPYECKLCKEKLRQRKALLDHIKKAHQEQLGSQEYSNVAILKKYGEIGKNLPLQFPLDNINGLKCTKCDKLFTSQRAHTKHQTRCKVTRFRKMCGLCPAGFRTDIGLKAHLQMHGEQSQGSAIDQAAISVNADNEENNDTKGFYCHDCSKTFHSKATFQDHQWIHMNSFPYACKLCNEKYRHRAILLHHIKKAHQQQLGSHEYRNTEILQRFGEVNKELPFQVPNIRKHPNKIRGKVKNFHCNDCSKSYVDKSGLKCHQLLHKNITRFPCEYCEDRFFSRLQARNHLKTKHPEKNELHKCGKCNKHFINIKYLQNHENVHNTKKNGRFICDICERDFGQMVDLKTHRLIHTNSYPFPCDQCSGKFRTQGHLNMHIRKVHLKLKVQEHKCSHCPSSFTQRDKLLRHESYHLKKELECPKCGKVFARPVARKHHEQFVCGRVRHFKCDICSKIFVKQQFLTRHRAKHTKPFQCQVCSKRYGSYGGLKLHIAYIHEGKKRICRHFFCEICGQKLSSRERLRRHISSIHRGEKPFSCIECCKSFAEKRHLQQHMLVHTGEKPHTCQFCGKAFRDKRNLNVHERSHTGEFPYKCDQCGKGFHRKNALQKHICAYG